MAVEQIVIKTSTVMNLLKSGYVRYKDQEEGYFGSVEGELGLSKQEAQEIFKNPRFKDIRVAKPSRIKLEDDIEGVLLVDDMADEMPETKTEEETIEEQLNGTSFPSIEDYTPVVTASPALQEDFMGSI